MSNSNMKIPVSKMLLQPGSIGVYKDGDNFCARLSLDSFVAFYAEAKAGHIEGNG